MTLEVFCTEEIESDWSLDAGLPHRGDVGEEESGQGYVLRMSTQNGLRGLPEIKALLMKSRYATLDAQVAPELSRWFGCHLPHLARALGTISTGDQDRTYVYGGATLERSYFVNRRTPRICAKCIRDHGQCRLVWDFSLLTACGRHGCALTDWCPSCRQPLDWNRLQFGWCDCGCPLASWDTDQKPTAAELDFACWLDWRIQGAQGVGVPQWSEHTPLIRILQPLGVNAGMSLVYALASSSQYLDGIASKPDRKKVSLQSSRHALCTVNDLLERIRAGEELQWRLSRPSAATRLLQEAVASAQSQADREMAYSVLSKILNQGGKTRWSSRHPQVAQMSLF